MAEKKTPSKSSSAAKKPQRVTSTNQSKAGGKPSPAKSDAKGKAKQSPKVNKPSAADKKAERERHAAEKAAREERRLRFMRSYMPYILCAIALFLVVCFVVTLFSDDGMGAFGSFVCHALFGCFTWVAYLIPAVLVMLTIFWQRYFQTGKVISKLVLSIVLLLQLASLSHVIISAGNEEIAEMLSVPELFETGAVFESGGVIGGLLGHLLFWALRLPGTIVLTVITLPLIIMTLMGVTPLDVFIKIRDIIREQKAKKDEADEEDNDEADDDDEEEEEPAETRKPVRVVGRARRKAERADQAEDEEAEDEEGSPVRSNNRRVAMVDTETGEVLDNESDADEEMTESFDRSNRHTRERGDRLNHSDRQTDGERRTYVRDLRKNVQEIEDDEDQADDSTERVERTAAEAGLRHRTARRADASDTRDDLPWDDDPVPAAPAIADAAPAHNEDDDAEDDITERIEVDLDEEPAARTDYRATSSHGVNFEVVTGTTSNENAAQGTTTDVRIHRPDTTAVAEKGLSDEEVVLPSGQGAFSTVEDADAEEREYVFPDIDMLTRGPDHYASNDEEIAENTQILRDVLQSFRIGVREISCSCGPTITRFEVKPDTGVRVRSIANLVDDIAMGLAKAGVRIEAPIPGKNAVGIEVPNAEPDTVYLRNILETPEFRGHKSRIAACLGADVSGRPVILDINKMPHLLIAGATGTGKSVCINSLIMSILYKAKPDEVKLILIDPKKVEFAMYRDLPHLYAPVVSDPKKAAGALNSAVNEMEHRFELIEEVGVRNLAGYNEITAGDPERPPLPQMVIIIDELADLMMTAPAEVETAICRLAQKARAAGIHLIIGTQRPSVDVITGLIKANVPSRIAFTVKSGVDSRTILDTVGADKLIGRGDMLYAPIGCNKPIRAQGCFVTESEVERVVTFIKEHNDGPVYNEDFARSIDMEAAKCGSKKKGEQMSDDDFDSIGGERADGEDPKFWEALEIAVTKDKIGTSALQRGCNLGYGRAAKIIDRMEELGFVGPDPGTKQGRKVLISKQDLIQYKLNGLPGCASDNDAGNEDIDE